MKTFRTLDLAVEFYNLTEKATASGHLRDQLLRASSLISLNLAEGNAKRFVEFSLETILDSLTEFLDALKTWEKRSPDPKGLPGVFAVEILRYFTYGSHTYCTPRSE